MAFDKNQPAQDTETHMSKKYNDILYDRITAVNKASMQCLSQVHFDSLLVYYAAIEALYTDCAFLFKCVKYHVDADENVDLEKNDVFEVLTEAMETVEKRVMIMTLNPVTKKEKNFFGILTILKDMMRLMMASLQKRNMLVRMSDREVRGKDTVDKWSRSKMMAKGGMPSDAEFERKLTLKGNKMI